MGQGDPFWGLLNGLDLLSGGSVKAKRPLATADRPRIPGRSTKVTVYTLHEIMITISSLTILLCGMDDRP